MLQMLMITEKYVILIRLYFFASFMNNIFFVKKLSTLEKQKICLLHSESTNLFSLNTNQNKNFNWIKVNYFGFIFQL